MILWMALINTAGPPAVEEQNTVILGDLAHSSTDLVDRGCGLPSRVCTIHTTTRRHTEAFRRNNLLTTRSKPRTTASDRQHNALARPAVQKKISSQTSWLASWLVQAIEDLQFQFTWIVLGPSILGQDLCFDTAVIAFCQASEVYLRRTSTPSRQDDKISKAALVSYGRAVTLLRHKLASSNYTPSESATATSSALATFDLLMSDGAEDKTSHSASFAHFEACKWYLEAQSRDSSSPPTTIARAFMQDYCRFELFRVCSLGKLNAVTESICENAFWSGMEPFSITPLPSNYASLQRASHEIDLRLARLTQYVRMLRDGESMSPSEVIALADIMLEFENLPAEDEALHQVRVVQTADSAERHIVPVSFVFDSHHWPMLVHYWATLLTIVRISLLIDLLARREHRLNWLDGAKTAKLVETQQRIVSNLLMSRQYAFDRSIAARLQVVHPLVIVWATLAGRSVTPQGVPVAELKRWILIQLQRSGVSFLRDWTEYDLDNATEVFSIPDRLKRQQRPD